MQTSHLCCGVVALLCLGTINFPISRQLIQCVFAQDPNYGRKGYFTEPVADIKPRTTNLTDGTIGGGDGEGSLNSLRGYTLGVALPENAATVNSTDCIGLLVRWLCVKVRGAY